MFNPRFFANSLGDGHGVLEIVAEPSPEERPIRRFVPLRHTHLRGEIVGPLAALSLVQTFAFSASDHAGPIEACYRFPLPGDVAVTRVRVRFGDSDIEATLKRRAEAEREYEDAKAQGHSAALTTRESPDVFTLQVSGIHPDEEVVVYTDYVQLVRPDGDSWQLRTPLTTAPRYTRSDEAGGAWAAGQPLAVMRDPGHTFEATLRLRDAVHVSSPTHALDLIEEEGETIVRLAGGPVTPDRDWLLRWETPTADHASLRLYRYDDAAEGQSYFLALIAPPSDATAIPLPREAILLVDHSGSMQGAKWEAADWTAQSFIGDLTPSDLFNLGLFHNTTSWFAKDLRVADARTQQEAVRFLLERKDSGGTELGVALEQALGMSRRPDERARHVLVVTDGQVTDSGRLFQLVERERQQPTARRISVICIDAAPNHFLTRQLAERGGGTAHFLTSKPTEGDITGALEALLAEWAAPLLANVTLTIQRPDGTAADDAVQTDGPATSYYYDVGDVGRGRARWIVGRVPLEGGPLSASLFDGTTTLAEASSTASDAPAALKALFGAERVMNLESLMHGAYPPQEWGAALQRLGYSPDEIPALARPALYAENQREQQRAALDALLADEALRYGLASGATAFVAVRREAGEVVAETVEVANALPAGWSDTFAGGGPQFLAASVSSGLSSHSTAVPKRRRRQSGGLLDTISGLFERGGDRDFARQIRLDSAAPPPAPSGTARFSRAATHLLFDGRPTIGSDGSVTLFDSATTGEALQPGLLRRLVLSFPQGEPSAESLGEATLLLFIGDSVTPRVRVRVADLVRQQGRRPLNVIYNGEWLRLDLVNAPPDTEWPPMHIEIEG